MTERLRALTEGNAWEFRYEKSPKCPHCGHVCDVSGNDWWRLYEEGEHEVECPLCDEGFTVSTHVQHSFSTDEQETS
jgi:uncharacterized Zn-finger protein